MSQHGSREQKKLAKKKAKRAQKRTMINRDPDARLMSMLRSAAEWPIVEAFLPVNLGSHGIGNCLIARQMPDGRIAFANILVDMFALGVKDAFAEVASLIQYRTMKGEIDNVGRLRSVPAELYAKLISGAVAYARAIGIEPHADFALARLLLAGIDTSACEDEFEFGKDGKPFYIQGPNESPARARAIASKVHAAGGRSVLVSDGMPSMEFAETEEMEP